MSNSYAIFEELLNDIMQRTGHDEAEICRLCDRNPGYISQIKSRYKNKGEEIPKKFVDLLRLRFAMPDNKTQKVDNDKNELSLHSLIESNKVLVETNKELTELLKVIINSNSAHSAPSQDTLWAILERIAEQGQKFWGTKEEGLKELGRYLSGGQEKEKPKGR